MIYIPNVFLWDPLRHLQTWTLTYTSTHSPLWTHICTPTSMSTSKEPSWTGISWNWQNHQKRLADSCLFPKQLLLRITRGSMIFCWCGNNIKKWEMKTTRTGSHVKNLKWASHIPRHNKRVRSKGTHNADSIIEFKVIYYLKQCGLRV